MAILETSVPGPVGHTAYRNPKANGFAKNLSLVFVCATAARVLWHIGWHATFDLDDDNSTEANCLT
jgi:hypothetical protein